jgi:2-methylcitrate dehydratase
VTVVEKLAQFIQKADFKSLSQKTRDELKIRLLDSLGCALGALTADPIKRIHNYLELMGGSPLVTLIGGGKTAPDRAAFYNGALVRYLDFNDSFLAKNETCHPSDNIAAVLAAAEFSKASGKEFLLSLAISYAIQCRLSEVAPVRAKGFDHTVQGSYAAAGGVAKALKLSSQETAHAIAISAVAHNALRVTRTGVLSHWKGLAYPETAFASVHSAFLAREGITGPLEIFEGNKGFMDSIAGKFSISWEDKDLSAVERTIIKKYNAEIHSQTSIEAVLELKKKYGFSASDIEKIEISIFDVAYHIIGGGVEGSKKSIRTKEEADHSLPYLVSVALLDGEVMPSQYHPERILKPDVQELLKKVDIRPDDALTARFPNEMATRVKIHLKDGSIHSIEKSDYEGFWTKPMNWETALHKFRGLCKDFVSEKYIQSISDAVHNIEDIQVADLCNLLGKCKENK